VSSSPLAKGHKNVENLAAGDGCHRKLREQILAKARQIWRTTFPWVDKTNGRNRKSIYFEHFCNMLSVFEFVFREIAYKMCSLKLH